MNARQLTSGSLIDRIRGRYVAHVASSADQAPARATDPPRVFLVHHEQDADAARELARGLREEYGVDAWFKGWELLAGDVMSTRIEEGLRKADGGLVLVGNHTLSGWSGEEYAALLGRAQVENSRCFLIPVVCGDTAPIPPFLDSRIKLRVDDVEGIVRAVCLLLGIATGDKPRLGVRWRPRDPVEVALRLRREGDVVIVTGDMGEGRASLPVAEAAAMGRRLAPGRTPTREAPASPVAQALAAVGGRLSEILAGPVAEALALRLDPAADRGDALVRLMSEDLTLLALPWEAAGIPGRGPLGLIAHTGVMREVAPTHPRGLADIPGPLRVLVAVAAPHDDLDTARELDNILRAVDGARLGHARVVFVDESAATLDGLRRALETEPFHVVHIAAHGGPGALQFEDPDGDAVAVTPSKIAGLLVQAAHRPGLVILSTCSSGAASGEAGHVHAAGVLVRAGVPQVIAMQGPVGDGYATELARHFYQALARSAAPTAVWALAVARQQVEYERCEHAKQGQQFIASEPEYATPAFYGAPDVGDRPLFDGTSPGDPVDPPPAMIHVPGLAARPLGAIVGRRRLRRQIRQVVHSDGGHTALLWGTGGVGKSCLAANVLDGLRRDGWSIVVVVGSFTLGELGRECVVQLRPRSEALGPVGRAALDALRGAGGDESMLLGAVTALLANERVALLLDNFEDNLQRDAAGGVPTFVDGPRTRTRLAEHQRPVVPRLAAAATCGALLVTCRYPVAALLDGRVPVTAIEVGPLAVAGVHQLVWRLAGLRRLPPADLRAALDVLGGHPRVLEFADALLRTTPGRWDIVFSDIRGKIEELMDRGGLELPRAGATMAERLELATRMAASDVLLDALLETIDRDTREFLGAVAVYRRGVPDAALDVVARATGLAWDGARRRHATALLAGRTLLSRLESPEQDWVVHRWTAAELHRRAPASAAVHSAAANWWWARGQTWDEHLEAIEHWLAAGEFETASGGAEEMRITAEQGGENLAALALCERMVAGLPEGDLHARWLVNMAGHLAVLGETEKAVARLESALEVFQALAEREPGRADLQRDLSVSYERLGDLHRALGDGATARRYYEDSLAIAKALAEREPENQQALGDLALSYERMARVDAPAADWLRRAVELHRTRLAKDSSNVVIARELAIALYNTAVGHATDPVGADQARRESHALLSALHARGALEAQYHDLARRLADHFTTG